MFRTRPPPLFDFYKKIWYNIYENKEWENIYVKKYIDQNKVYLYLLAFYDGCPLPPSTVLAKQIGITRQTVSKRYKELKDAEIISLTPLETIIVKNEYNIDKDILRNFLQNNSNYTYEALLSVLDLPFNNRKEIEEKYGISVRTLKNEETKDNNFCYIYGIVVNEILEYIGSTNNFELRKKQHILRRPFLKDENFVILKKLSSQDKLDEEKLNIKLYNPEWNEMSKIK